MLAIGTSLTEFDLVDKWLREGETVGRLRVRVSYGSATATAVVVVATAVAARKLSCHYGHDTYTRYCTTVLRSYYNKYGLQDKQGGASSTHLHLHAARRQDESSIAPSFLIKLY